MREILFRGKRIDNGEWAEGYPVVYPSGKTEIIENCTESPDVLDACEVDPETICQYAGFADRNGAKVFEHDILRFTGAPGDDREYRVKWDTFWHSWSIRDTELGITEALPPWLSSDWEVVGTVFDRPSE